MKGIKPVIDVDIPCVIIPSKTGVIYFNQVGGYAVHDLKVEGYIIPLSTEAYVRLGKGEKSNCNNPYWNKYNIQEQLDKIFAPLKKGTKYDGHCYNGIDVEDAEHIESLFQNPNNITITVDKQKLKECEEAKIFVTITLKQYNHKGEETKPIHKKGILTWENSD